VGSVNLQFEEQKNGENGEKKLFVRNNDKPHVCFIKNFMQIMQRHAQLTKSNPSLPLSVYRHDNGSICNITSTDVETLMCQAASELFNLHKKKQGRTPNVVQPFPPCRSLHNTLCNGFSGNGDQTFTVLEIRYIHDLPAQSGGNVSPPQHSIT
jgi:hypothetical protein